METMKSNDPTNKKEQKIQTALINLHKTVKEIQLQLRKLNKRVKKSSRKNSCFKCGQQGHLRKKMQNRVL